jgi:Fur family transcriptional regulator, zinc uptake regulator
MPRAALARKPEHRAFPPERHDHAHCVADALSMAARVCAERDGRLTPIRRRVLELVWSSHRPVGAYDILASLQGDGRSAAPPTVYRALEFLMEHGLVHRIESLNAFVGCADPRNSHAGQFFICENCRSAAEVTDTKLAEALAGCAQRLGFAVKSQTVEFRGLCPACAAG